ncbi:MAG TPA: hypothetical protein VMV11_02255 [Acidimicrobiales bacterium]|nr:hypothetical protein [Acidimicrobiales bacterium]
MSHRFTTWWRALSVVLLSLATVTWPSASWANATPGFTVVHQTALATLSTRGTLHFATIVRLTPEKAQASASVAIFPVLTTVAAMSSIVSGVGATGAAMASTGTFALNCLQRGEATFSVSVYTKKLKSPLRSCHGVKARLHLTCPVTGCAGVYPLRYRFDVNGTTITKWSLLAIKTRPVTTPLRVALVETLNRTSLQDSQLSINVLNALGHFASSPLTLSADYETLTAIDFDQRTETKWRSALNKALESPQHRAIDAPPGSIDFAGLSENGLTTQIPQQLMLSERVLKSLTGVYVDQPVLLDGAQTPTSLLALAGGGVSDVLLPEDELAQAPSGTLTWGAPFHLAGAGSVTALSIDGPLSALVSNAAIEPGRRAALTLAWLAFLHFEAPNAPASRTVVIEQTVGAVSTTFLNDLLGGLKNDPYSQLASLTPSFNSALIGTNGAPAIRTLSHTTSPSTWSAHNVSSLLTLIGAANSYAQSIRSGSEALILRVGVARTEILGNANARQSAINAANNQLNAQLGQFSIDASAITLAGQGTSLPITVISRAPYTVDAVVHLITDRVTFPKGNAVKVTMSSPTVSIRVPTQNPQGSSMTLQVVLTTPNGQVVLARSAIQVRIAGTSVVGYVLSFASLFVLGLWWWRTNRRRPKGRHAR